MSIIEQIISINDVLKEIFNYIRTDSVIKPDFDEYLATIGAKTIPASQIEKIFLPYIFERTIGGKAQTVIELFCSSGISKNQDIAKALKDNIYSAFAIKKVLKNGFELYNLVNEKLYTVNSLTKMTNLRGIHAGQFLIARIFNYKGEYYLVEIANLLNDAQKGEAYKYAVMRAVQNPELVYKDNPEKEKEIKENISDMYKKFIKKFNTEEIITSNKYADDIIGSFCDDEAGDLREKIVPVTEYKYFEVPELQNTYNNFMENSVGGFATHNATYDVGIVFDKEKGLYAIPFYQTFCKIFEGENVENKEACIKYFLTNDAVSDRLIKRVADKYSNFMEIINGILKTNYTFDELIKHYKSYYLEHNMYSSATVLYTSQAFSGTFDFMETMMNRPQPASVPKNIGRNDPCPCGSGKKYKNCCMNAAVQV